MEKATFKINTHADITKAISFMHSNYMKALDDKKPLVVQIDNKQEDRTKAQNRLYWKWVTQWSKHQGTEKDYEHLYFKKNILSIIFYRDDVSEYRNTFDAVKMLRDEKHPMYEKVASGLNELISTTDANVNQFTEYLNDIHAFCLKNGVYLNTPDDLKWCWSEANH